MEPIRILQVFTTLNIGGAESMIMNYYRKMDRSKVQFDFLVHTEEKGVFENEIEALGGKIHRLPPVQMQNFLKYKNALRSFFNEYPEYKIIHSHISEMGYYLFREAINNKVPVVICHSHLTESPVRDGSVLKKSILKYFRYRLNGYITHRLVCSELAGDWLFGEKYRDGFIHMNNAVDCDHFKFSTEKRLMLRKKLNIEDKFVLGHVGRFDDQKNHDFLIDIFDCVRAKYPEAVLLLVGVGPKMDEIKKKVESLNLSDSVIFLGLRRDISELMMGMDVLVFPSLYEGLPVVLVEAQASGLHCVLSDTISSQTKITDYVDILSLNAAPSSWADLILKYNTEYERELACSQIKIANYDITENAKWLQDYYMDLYAK